jgi:hypothetical protein
VAKDQIQKTAEAVAKAAQQVADAPDEAARHDALRTLRRAQARMERAADAGSRQGLPKAGRERNLRSQRDVIVDTLDEVGVPMSHATIYQYARARFGAAIAGSRFAPLRRDEEKSWRKNAASRPTFIAPALHADGGEPINRLLTLTTWDLPRRIVGPRSERFAYLMLCERVLGLAHDNPDDEALVALAARLHPRTRDQAPEQQLDEIREELDLVRRLDEPDRVAAAERLGSLSPDIVIWGNRGITGVVEARNSS